MLNEVPRVVRERYAGELGEQLFIGERPDKALFNQAVHRDDRVFLNKPYGGLWTSSLVDGTSDWVRWCQGEDFGGVDVLPWWRVVVEPSTVVLEIDSYDDLLAIMKWGGVRSRPWDWMHKEMDALNFDVIRAAGFGGVHLTRAGASACRYGPGVGSPSLSSWDVESTVWLDWVFTDIVCVKEGVQL